MTTRLTHLALLAALLCGGIHATQAAPLTQAEQQAATATVTGYLESLISGDIPRLRAHLSPEFRQKRAGLLDRQDYLQNLQTTYANAGYAILDMGRPDDGTDDLWVDARLTLASGEAVNIRFRLAAAGGRYLIMEEY